VRKISPSPGFNPRTVQLVASRYTDYDEGNIFYLKVQFVPREKHSVSVIKTGHLTLYMEIIAVRCEIHKQHSNTLRGQKVEFLNVKAGDI